MLACRVFGVGGKNLTEHNASVDGLTIRLTIETGGWSLLLFRSRHLLLNSRIQPGW